MLYVRLAPVCKDVRNRLAEHDNVSASAAIVDSARNVLGAGNGGIQNRGSACHGLLIGVPEQHDEL